jgi:DNA repair ATPase RecN
MKNSPGKKTGGLPRDTKSLKNLHTKQINLSTGQLDKSTGQLDKSTGQLDKSTGQLDKSTGQLDKSTGQLDNFNETLQLVKAITRHFAASQDPLAKYKALEYAANHIMLLPTSKIQELTEAKPSKSSFQRGIFIFTKIENTKIGRETAWRVQMTSSAFRQTT